MFAPAFAGGAEPASVTARFAIDEATLHHATTSAELIEALRENLTVDLAMPLDEPLFLALKGFAGDPEGAMPVYHFTLSSLGIGYQGKEPLEGFPFAEAVRETHDDDFPPDDDVWAARGASDWSEDAAWDSLVTALDKGLPQSSEAFARPGPDQHVALRVGAVHALEFAMKGEDDPAWRDFGWCCDDLAAGAVFQIRPALRFQSMMTGETPAELPYRLNVLVAELEPGDVVPVSETGAASAEEQTMASMQLIEFGCQTGEFAGRGTSTITLAGEEMQGSAAYQSGPEGEVIVAAGLFEDGALSQCLMIYGPAAEAGASYTVRDSASVLMGEPTDGPPPYAAAFATGFGDPAQIVVIDEGTVTIDATEPTLRGSYDLTGWLDATGDRKPVEITGRFEAEEL